MKTEGKIDQLSFLNELYKYFKQTGSWVILVELNKESTGGQKLLEGIKLKLKYLSKKKEYLENNTHS